MSGRVGGRCDSWFWVMITSKKSGCLVVVVKTALGTTTSTLKEYGQAFSRKLILCDGYWATRCAIR